MNERFELAGYVEVMPDNWFPKHLMDKGLDYYKGCIDSKMLSEMLDRSDAKHVEVTKTVLDHIGVAVKRMLGSDTFKLASVSHDGDDVTYTLQTFDGVSSIEITIIK